MSISSKVLVIGLDGATLDLIEPWVQKGFLPAMAKLMESGGYGLLRSVQPVVSPAAWTTIVTGVNPGKHGIIDFVIRENQGYRLRPTMSQDIRTPSVWKLLGQNGRRVCVMNVPSTYPPEPVNGYLVSGLGTPNFKTFTHPPELSERLLNQGYQVNPKQYFPGKDVDAFLANIQGLHKSLTNAALPLIREENWDFCMVVYRETDAICHGFWRFMDSTHPHHEPNSPYQNVILDTYRLLDEQIGKLIEASGPETTVLILSDHGFGPLLKEVFLNEWLRQQGYLFTHSVPVWRRLLSQFGLTRANVSRVLRALHLARLERWIKDRIGNRITLLPRESWADFSEGIDWSRTRAYSFGFQGQVYVNLKGREPQGIVQPGEEYHALVEELRQKLTEFVDPQDDKPVVDHIYRRDEIFHGGAISHTPELVVNMRDLAYVTHLGYELKNHPGEIIANMGPEQSGTHRPNGLLIAAGPGIHAIGKHPTAWVGDITPTILHLLGCAIPEWIDGQPLISWLDPQSAKLPIQKATGLTSEKEQTSSTGLTEKDEKEIMKRLSDLGYLE